MAEVQVNGTNIFYIDEGQGHPIIFIHGLGGNHRMWAPQIERFKKNYRVIVPDLRGCGESGILTSPLNRILDTQCKDINLLLDLLQLQKVILCGVSYGGVFNFHYLLKYPNKVAGLVVLDSFGDTKIVGIVEAVLMLFQYLFFWIIFLPNPILIYLIKRKYNKWPAARKYVIEIVKNMRKREYIHQSMAASRVNHTKNLGKVCCPCLGVVGDTSKVSIRYMERAIKEIDDAELIIVDNSFDPTNLCQSEKFNDLLKNFLLKIKWETSS